MAITDKKKGVWGLDQTFNKINQGSIWEYSGPNDPNQLWIWGDDQWGQLGQKELVGDRSSPVRIPGEWDKLWRLSRTEAYQMAAAKTAGSLWVWGFNNIGVLGQGEGGAPATQYSSPVQIPGTTWNKVHVGSNSAYALKTDGTLWTWGDGEYGELGHNQANPGFDGLSSPTQVPSKAGTTWTYLSGGDSACNAINSAGEWYSWGRYYYGAPFNASLNNNRSSPTQIPGTDWAFVDYSNVCGAAIKTNGTLWTFGGNNNGALGINEQGNWPAMTTSRSSPTQVPGTTWSKCYCLTDAMYAFKTDGTLWTWGHNASGQLGLNQPGTTKYSSPVQIPGTTWSSAYMDFSPHKQGVLAIKTDGSLWAWGKNQSGSLGLNNETQYSSPTQIGSATNWDVCAISGGPAPSAMALTT